MYKKIILITGLAMTRISAAYETSQQPHQQDHKLIQEQGLVAIPPHVTNQSLSYNTFIESPSQQSLSKRDTQGVIGSTLQSLSQFTSKISTASNGVMNAWVALPEGQKLLVSGFGTASVAPLLKLYNGIMEHDEKKMKEAGIQLFLGVTSLIVMLTMTGPMGMVIGGLLSGLATFLFPVKQLTPEAVFEKLWGKINGMVQKTLYSRLTATRVNNIQNLLADLKESLHGYVTLMKIDSTLPSRGKEMAKKNKKANTSNNNTGESSHHSKSLSNKKRKQVQKKLVTEEEEEEDTATTTLMNTEDEQDHLERRSPQSALAASSSKSFVQTNESLSSTPNMIYYRPDKVLPHGSQDVRLYMSQIDTLIRGNYDWYTRPTRGLDSNRPDSFMLLSAIGFPSPKTCLHTSEDKLADGTYLVVDDQCDLDNHEGKTFGYDPESGQLLLKRSSQTSSLGSENGGGDMCVVYASEHGSRIDSRIAVYSQTSPQCKYAAMPVRVGLIDGGGLALFTGKDQLCLSDAKKNEEVNTIVNPAVNGCKYQQLSFKLQLPVPTVGLSSTTSNEKGGRSMANGGVSADDATPYISFREIGVQLFYFPSVAAIHLLSMKERYLYGDEQQAMKEAFARTVERYKSWLDVFIPMFVKYTSFIGMDASKQVQDAIDFRTNLDLANIDGDQVVWKIPL